MVIMLTVNIARWFKKDAPAFIADEDIKLGDQVWIAATSVFILVFIATQSTW